MFRIVLKKLRDEKGLSQKALADILNVAQGTIGNWESGVREPNFKTIEKLADFFDVSTDYLLGREDNTKPLPTGNGVWIPVLGKVQAGIPMEAIQDILDYEEIDFEMAGHGEYFALQVRGDSMEPKFSNGDVVIVRKQPDVDTGDIAVVLVNGSEATVKKIKKRPNGLELIPLNSDYDVMLFTPEEIETLPVTILGKVVELRAKFR